MSSNVQTVDFEKPLLAIKEEIDALDVKITGCEDNMVTLKPYADQYAENRDTRKGLKKLKREKMGVLRTLTEFYKKATGEMPDGIYPLFSRENTETQTQESA